MFRENSDLSLSAESDQKAALPPIDTSWDDSEVGKLLLGIQIEKAVRLANLLNYEAVSG